MIRIHSLFRVIALFNAGYRYSVVEFKKSSASNEGIEILNEQNDGYKRHRETEKHHFRCLLTKDIFLT